MEAPHDDQTHLTLPPGDAAGPSLPRSLGGLRREIGDYLVEQELGAGGMGCVYLVQHKQLKRRSALKMLLPEIAANAEMREQFLHEGRVLASFNHPGIVTIYTVVVLEDGQVGLEMEYVGGGDLKAELKAKGHLPERRARDVLLQILEALAYMHQRHRIHCDLKPANVLLTNEGKVKISDFGLANFVGVDLFRTVTMAASAARPSSSLAGGTLAYMPPEAFEPNHTPDKPNDVWAVGVMAVELMLGRHEVARTLWPERPLADLRWNDLLRGCLERDPAKRWTAAQARDHLRRMSGGRVPFWLLFGGAAAACGAAAVALPTLTQPPPPTPGTRLVVREVLAPPPVETGPVAVGVPTEEAPRPPAPLDLVLVGTQTDIRMRLQNADPGVSPALGTFRGPRETLRLDWRAQPYLIEFAADGFEGKVVAVDPARPPGEVLVDLEPLVLTRTFALATTPAAAYVELAGRNLGLTPRTVELTFTRASSAEAFADQTVRLNAPGHDPAELSLGPASAPAHTVPLVSTFRPLEVELAPGVRMRFLPVLAGELTVPARAGGTRLLRVAEPFLMGETEVTQAQYKALMEGRDPSMWAAFDREDTFPVEQVLFRDLAGDRSFLAALNRALAGAENGRWQADLPTEMEWEYACRAGQPTAFHDGSDLAAGGAAPGGLSRIAVLGRTRPAPVKGDRLPNAWGFYDLHGNVAEWTKEGLLKGGAFDLAARDAAAQAALTGLDRANRADDRFQRFGFRVALRAAR